MLYPQPEPAHQRDGGIEQRHSGGLVSPHVGAQAQPRLLVLEIDRRAVGSRTLGDLDGSVERRLRATPLGLNSDRGTGWAPLARLAEFVAILIPGLVQPGTGADLEQPHGLAAGRLCNLEESAQHYGRAADLVGLRW